MAGWLARALRWLGVQTKTSTALSAPGSPAFPDSWKAAEVLARVGDERGIEWFLVRAHDHPTNEDEALHVPRAVDAIERLLMTAAGHIPEEQLRTLCALDGIVETGRIHATATWGDVLASRDLDTSRIRYAALNELQRRG